MRELGEHQPAFGVNGRRQLLIPRHNAVVDVYQGQPIGPDFRPDDGRCAGDLHAEPGASAPAMIGDIALARQTIFGQARLVPRQKHPAAEPLAANLQPSGYFREGLYRVFRHCQGALRNGAALAQRGCRRAPRFPRVNQAAPTRSATADKRVDMFASPLSTGGRSIDLSLWTPWRVEVARGVDRPHGGAEKAGRVVGRPRAVVPRLLRIGADGTRAVGWEVR